MSLRSLLLTALVIAAGWYWLQSRELKELALRRAARYCDDLGVSLLDQTVVLKSLGFGRNARGTMCLRRRYEFDFTSTGEQRYQGEIRLLGKQVEAISLQPHRID